MKKRITLFWIDDMENWSSSAGTNLGLIAPKYNIELIVINAINGEDVCQKLMMYDIDAVIMDYHMEPFNGDKYIEDIRNEQHLSYIPIIFYSQDNTTNLMEKVKDHKDVTTVYRPNLEDKIKEMFFK